MNSLCHRYLNQNILPYVGRVAELRRLQDLFSEFLDEGESKYVLIAANSGGGKTRLVLEFEERLAQEFGETCVIVHARYLESNVAALTPIVNGFEACLNQQANLKQYLQKASVFPISEILTGFGDRIPGSVSISPQFSVSGPRSPSKIRPPALQILLDSFSEIAKRFPLVLILEDVHNMDDLPVFDQFFLGLSSAAKFVVLTERRNDELAVGDLIHRGIGTGDLSDQEEVSDETIIKGTVPGGTVRRLRSFEHLLREVALREERASDILLLSDFAAEETRQIFQILFDIEPSQRLLDTVHARTLGRPLALRTMLRQLVRVGVLLYEEGQWREDANAISDTNARDAGESVDQQEMLARFQREVERLNASEQDVAMHAALLGEQFDVRLLRSVLRYRLGEAAFTDDLFQRAIDLLTFKSIIRRATPSISFSTQSDRWEGEDFQQEPPYREEAETRVIQDVWCYEFSHAHFWNTILESARDVVSHEHDLILAIVWIAGTERLPLYSSAFLSITTPPFALAKVSSSSEDGESLDGAGLLRKVEHFLRWSSRVVRSIWSQEPRECLRLLLGIRPLRDEIAWRFGAELSQAAMGALLDLHTQLVEAHLRNGSSIEAERELEQAAVLEKFIQASPTMHPKSIAGPPQRARYASEFAGIARGRVAVLRAILYAGRTSYAEFERSSNEARAALEAIPEANMDERSSMERAYLLTLLTRTKGEALLNAGRFREADALIEEGMPTAKLLAETRFDEYSLYYRLAVNSKLKQDQNDLASELTSQIMRQAKEHGNTLVETMFLFQAALAAFSSGDVPAALAYCDLGIANGRRYGIRFVETMSYLWRMIIAGVQQDAEKVKECSRQLSILVEDARGGGHGASHVDVHGLVVPEAAGQNLLQRISLLEGRATAMNFLGRYPAALEYAEEAIQLAASHQHDSFAAWAQNEKALALIGLGRFEESLAVATGCLELAGEQRLAERTARTALIMAYAGMGRFEEARKESELARAEYKERSPYFLRFALAESRFLRLLAGCARTIAERQALRQRLLLQVEAMMELATAWDAPLLEEQLRKEFEDVLPKRNATGHEEDNASLRAILMTSERERRNSVLPAARLLCFGPMVVENGTGMEPSKEERLPGRDNKVRQLIALLVAARAETLETRSMTDHARDHRQFGRSRAAANGAVARERLLDLLWPDSTASNINALYTTIRRARAFLGTPESILLNEDGYCISPAIETDCEAVLRHYDEARRARKRNALFSITFHYEQILKRTDRGPFMAGIYGSSSLGDDLDGWRTRFTTLRRTAAVRLIEIELERGLLERAEEVCLKLLAQDEFDEEALRGLLMINASRRQTAKLVRLFEEYSKKLKSELHAEPSKELRSLYASLVATGR